MNRVANLVAGLRKIGKSKRGQAAAIAWNPSLAWTEALEVEVRAHLGYMVVDMPPAERAAVDLDDPLAFRLRDLVRTQGPESAGPLLPRAVVDRFAVTGTRVEVVARLRTLLAEVRPELLLFEAHDYSNAYLADAGALASEAGVAANHA